MAESIFRDDVREHEIEQVVRSTGLGAASGHFESAERVATDDCPGDGAIDVKISDLELAAHAFAQHSRRWLAEMRRRHYFDRGSAARHARRVSELGSRAALQTRCAH